LPQRFSICERRARQAALIEQWKPWERSIGPMTAEGKAKVRRTPYKDGTRALLRELGRVLRRWQSKPPMRSNTARRI